MEEQLHAEFRQYVEGESKLKAGGSITGPNRLCDDLELRCQTRTQKHQPYPTRARVRATPRKITSSVNVVC